MACGLTPELMAMIASKQAEDDSGEYEQTVQARRQRAARARVAEEAERKAAEAAGRDWTASYGKWDKWQDQEEVAEQERQEHEAALRRARGRSACDHDHSAERAIMDLSTSEKLAKCEAFKADGNLHFAEGLFGRAADKYKAARVYLEYVFEEGEEERARMMAVKLSSLLNSAACALRTGDLDEGLQCVHEALQADPGNAKALWRRSQMLRARDDLDGAMEAIRAALAASPESRDLRKELQLVQSKVAAYRERERDVSRAMFSPASASASASSSSASSSGAPRRQLLGEQRGDEQALDNVSWPLSGAAAALELALSTCTGDDGVDAGLLS